MITFRGKPYKYEVFITHTWKPDECGRDNHLRAKRINTALKAAGIKSWFDEEKMHGNIKQTMLSGIDESALVIVLVTRQYEIKVNGSDQGDNCLVEFNYTVNRKLGSGPEPVIPVVMEPCMRDPKDWKGSLIQVFKSYLGCDFSDDFSDDEVFDSNIADLVNKVRDALRSGSSSTVADDKSATSLEHGSGQARHVEISGQHGAGLRVLEEGGAGPGPSRREYTAAVADDQGGAGAGAGAGAGPSSSNHTRRQRRWVLVAFVMLIVIVGVGVGVGARGSSKEEPPVSPVSPAAQPTPAVQPSTAQLETARPSTAQPSAQPPAPPPTQSPVQSSAQPEAQPTTPTPHKFTNRSSLQVAVDAWCIESANATATYGNISEWDVSTVPDFDSLFSSKTTCNPPIGNWNTAAVTIIKSLFDGASAFNQPIGNWNTAAVTDMSLAFRGASAFNQPIGNWKTFNVKNMKAMFLDASAFNQPLPWRTEMVSDMTAMFKSAGAFNQAIDAWNTYAVDTMQEMFHGAKAFNQKLCWVPAQNTVGIFIGTGCPNEDCKGTGTPGECK
jgi:surface protein